MSDRNFVASFREMQRAVHATALEKGWWDECQTVHNGKDRFQPEFRNFGEAIALMHSELSEALEWARHGNKQSDHIPGFSGIEEEFADVIIRIMDWAEANQLDVANAVAKKANFNAAREHKHGGKKF
jgi:NTP pyrophosphatase (non-canonical NTP hydrolase)